MAVLRLMNAMRIDLLGSNLSGIPVHAGLYHPPPNLWR